ncbi:MAG: hypothetical protein EOM45_08310 [Clostridia bacterium]|nr:hypothetical protein [Clostridia bacterium]
MNTGRSDLLWNYAASFMRLASAMIILPLILRLLPDQEVGLWNVMIGLNAMIYLLDFGFFQTFSRSVTYIFSGARELKGEGLGTASEDGNIDYSLLKGALSAMRVYYAGVAIFLLILLFTGGYFYIEKLLEGYSGDAENARLAWYLYGILLSYQFYTYYYDALLVGRGMIKRSRQIIVFSQCTHIILASTMLIMGFGIISMVCGQTLATILNRMLSRRAFYDKATKSEISKSKPTSWTVILKTLWKTAYKSGLANLSLVFTNKMLTLIGGLFIPLAVLGSYGITKQLADLTYTLSLIWFMTFLPKLTQNRLLGRESEVKRIYIKAQYIAIGVFAALSVAVVTLGPWALRIIKSNTPLLGSDLLVILFAASLFEAFTFLSTSVLVSKNTVPHYKAQMVTAVATILILLTVLNYTKAGVIALIVVPFSVQLIYQHWKWTCVVIRDLKVRLVDYDPRKYLKF